MGLREKPVNVPLGRVLRELPDCDLVPELLCRHRFRHRLPSLEESRDVENGKLDRIHYQFEEFGEDLRPEPDRDVDTFNEHCPNHVRPFIGRLYAQGRLYASCSARRGVLLMLDVVF